ncbi:MAG: DNA cytosine methyltransferase [Burkholderiales bacterium]|nr:DNA cytosine methyltransferase [Burkholderiales bacterium]
MRALDLFCGAGLGSSGAKSAGVTIAGAVDSCCLAAETYRENFPEAHVLHRRLEDVTPAKLRDRIGDVDLLLASPECTNHTCAKGSAPRSEESRATAMQVIRFASVFEPRWIVMENVVHMKPWPRYTELLNSLRGLGYQIREQVIDAAQLGVPQRRRRLFIICDRDVMPSEVRVSEQARPRWVRDILDPDHLWKTTPLFRRGRAAETRARARRAMSELGTNKPFLIVYYGTDGCGGWQPLNRPLRTITTIDRFALVRPSPTGHSMRMLQVPELKRAMGLDSDYKLNFGTRRDKIRLLGNGVCPPVMRAVVETLQRTA